MTSSCHTDGSGVTFGASIRVDLGREIVMSVPASRTRERLLCRFNLHHKWVRRFDRDGGELYLQCIACGKDLHDIKRHTRIIDFGGGF